MASCAMTKDGVCCWCPKWSKVRKRHTDHNTHNIIPLKYHLHFQRAQWQQTHNSDDFPVCLCFSVFTAALPSWPPVYVASVSTVALTTCELLGMPRQWRLWTGAHTPIALPPWRRSVGMLGCHLISPVAQVVSIDLYESMASTGEVRKREPKWK